MSLKIPSKIAFFILLSFNFFVMSYFALRGELDFHSDIARDFLLLNEIEEKKIVLIGGSTSAAGVFHGPLWLYLNFPAYYFGNGNPVVVEWFLIFLVAVFTYINFHVAKSLFGKTTAYFFVIFLSSFLIPWGRALNHPEAALLLTPSFFYTFWQYIKTFKIKYLCFHILIAGIIIQLEIAFGIPFFLLSSIFLIYTLISKRKLNHSLAFFLLLIPLSTYILFDLRHDFFQLKNLIKYLEGEPGQTHPHLVEILKNRADYVSTIGSLVPQVKIINTASSLLFLLLIVKSVKKSKNKRIYLIFLYFLMGYFFLTLFSNHILLAHQVIPFVPIAMITFLSLAKSNFKKIVIPLIIVMIIINTIANIKILREAKHTIDSQQNSWKIMSTLANDVFKNPESEFGYFIYSPDKLSYVPKYAMVWATKNHPEKNAHYFTKKPITYVVSAPAPINDPYAKYFTNDFWIINSIKITKKPVSETIFASGYSIRRYELSDEEIAIPFDKYEDTGIHFR